MRSLSASEPGAAFDCGVCGSEFERFNAYAAARDLPRMLVAAMKTGQMGPAAIRAMPDWLVKAAVTHFIKAEEKAGSGGYASMTELAEALPYDLAIAQSIDGTIAKFKDIRQPVLLLGGSKSPDFLKRALDRLEQTIPNATRLEIAGVDHAAPWNVDPQRNPHGNPTAIAAELKTYFATAASAATAANRKASSLAETRAVKR